MNRILLLPILLCPSLAVFAQNNYFIDLRDGNRYETVRLGDKIWFRENLRYQTALSYYSNKKAPPGELRTGNFYAMQELDTICPKGWHVATIDEMESYIKWIAMTNNIPDSSVIRSISKDIDSSLRIVVGTVNPKADTLMRFISNGWVQGKKNERRESLTLWLRDTRKGDTKFHAHIGALGYIIHTHEHNIIDKPRLVRRFNVRCVCEASDNLL